MKIALITDLHWGTRGGSLPFAEIMGEFLDNQFFPTLTKEGITDVWILGDFTDSRKATNYQIVEFVREHFFLPLQKMGITVHFLCGNHDIFYRNSNDIFSVDSLFGDLGHIQSHTVPVEVLGGRVLVLPWINTKNHDDCMEAIEKTDAKYCFAHLEIDGAKMYKTSVSEQGLDRSVFKKFDTVFTGHYHHRSTYANIEYIGAAGFYNWQDFEDPRGFAILDIDTGSIQYHNNEHCIFKRVHYNDSKQDYSDVDVSPLAGHIVQLMVHKRGNDVMYRDFVKSLQKLDTIQFRVIDETIEELNTATDTENTVELAENAFELFRGYINDTDVEIDKGPVIELAKEIYDEALAKGL